MKIQDLLSSLNVEFAEAGNHHCRPGWLQLGTCPFCQGGNFQLGYHLGLGYFNCWRCGAHRTIETLTKLGLPFQEAKEFYESGRSLQVPEEKKRVGLKEPRGRGPLNSPHKLYLMGRGFDPEEIASVWKVEGIGLTPRLAWRIYIPIIARGQRVSWTTRAIGEVQQRYISASAQEEAINHKELVYGIDFCLHSILIVEGPTDAWRIGPGAGALFGTAFSSAQVRRLIKIPHRYVCFDSAPEAQKRARELASQLASFPGETQNIQIDAKDPGSASPKEISLLRKIARL